ncbi:hypothetical protein F441_11504 [Phytophthora nicotianae CJ01A1]|uniref:CBM1 domain-containing protein n=5 Tax=Phytophthora nicotianae TaxID=4792 RepID=W2PBJ7_PHYN3|nr:hypothetical protein PPTG_20188 [Phytophthora nicotianae INRA-310]ETK83521.1 hypothetical protein L915_11278 [Phytophthora nicotianae]ETP13261.1 hypothetical protein F441_11504 [Phytophthora nicotianae CJ01A1]ETP41323.1 hypothetical protein F442_11492 [Phytophthora nicotianae P10297]KUF89160.1 Cellulose synthase 2 [Phytophthora nicotianae]ETM43391.1 hypothetical protein L914_11116 [Phytophthora nicotianae]
MFSGGFKLQWMMVATVALTLVAATTSCDVTGSESSSASGSVEDWNEAGTDVDGEGEETTFDPLDVGGNGYGYGQGQGQGCPEDALWCPSLGQGLSRDPNNNCEFPPCPP